MDTVAGGKTLEAPAHNGHLVWARDDTDPRTAEGILESQHSSGHMVWAGDDTDPRAAGETLESQHSTGHMVWARDDTDPMNAEGSKTGPLESSGSSGTCGVVTGGRGGTLEALPQAAEGSAAVPMSQRGDGQQPSESGGAIPGRGEGIRPSPILIPILLCFSDIWLNIVLSWKECIAPPALGLEQRFAFKSHHMALLF